MHTFAVVVAQPGRTVPAHVVALLGSRSCADLTFVPEDHVLWHDTASRTYFAGWQAGASNLGVGSRWDVRAGSLTAFSGHVWHRARPWTTGSTWASQLADLFSREPLDRVAPELDGVFAAVSLAADGRGEITSDPLGIAVLYRAESADVVVVSNRAALAARLTAPADRAPQRDVEGAGWLVYQNSLESDRTTFAGVRTIPQGSVVRLSPAAMPNIDAPASQPWLGSPRIGSDDAAAEALLLASRHLRSLVRLFAQLPCQMRTLELTGGRDSRLILALLIDEGLAGDFSYVTWGRPELPDVQVASAIADRYGLDLRAAGRTSPGTTVEGSGPAPTADPAPESFEDRVRHHVFANSGAVSIWGPFRTSRVVSPNVALTGQFGEAMRTHFASTNGIQTFDDLRAFVRTGQLGPDGAGVLRPEVRRRYDELVIEQLEAVVPEGGTPQDAADGLWLSGRLRRWFGASHENDTRNRVFPLYSMPLMRAAFAIGSDRRRSEWPHFAVMREACDELARMSFVGRPWPAGAVTQLSGDETGYPTAPPVAPWRPPAPAAEVARPRRRSRIGRRRAESSRTAESAGEQGRMTDIDSKLPVLRSFVDLDRNHALFELVDRRKLMEALDNLRDLSYIGRRGVHDAVTAAIWLSGEERPDASLREANREPDD